MKVALLRLVTALTRDGVTDRMVDVQWRTDHLGTLGAIEIDRAGLGEILQPQFGEWY